MVTFLLIADELLVENLVDVGDGLLNLAKHLLELALELRHDQSCHRLLKLSMDDLPNC